MQQLRNKVCLVTGAGSGIGQATATLLAVEGATVLVADVNEAAAIHVASGIQANGGQAEGVPLNVADEARWEAVSAHVKSTWGQLDVLVNNAGISFAKPIAEQSLAEWRRVLSVNLDGAFLGTREAIRLMAGRGGSIVNVASVSGIIPYPSASAYAASKAALRLFSKIAAIECADARNGVRVNLVTPTGVKTPMWDTMPFFQDLTAKSGGREEAFAAMTGGSPSGAFYSADDVARAIVYLASGASSHLNGVELTLAQGHVP